MFIGVYMCLMGVSYVFIGCLYAFLVCLYVFLGVYVTFFCVYMCFYSPALSAAQCGIAVDDATDAAKNAAAIILTSPGLSAIYR